ncbi:Aldehyde/histidinol dehydrogenase [Radiomyces spectabilis]|uniref:Aldehyde/histidinol dehydrogenase n=1 Tax=Radiomyces spectabilis TaxID=64574 RepID=UPI00221E662F|nr:Aldehyde/histidinol dehydrogenase [Radiomyces spectabilis]KAI8391630.1 Aldehyde/histidinol dehydrogenase [Radiomyces spectabilis]
MNPSKFTSVDAIPSLVQSLRDTFDTGVTKDIQFRKQQLEKLIQFMDENMKNIEKAIWDDLRKHKLEANIGEVNPVIMEAQYMIKNLDRLTQPVSTTKRFAMNSLDKTLIRREPKGVVLIIGAWNYPINLALLPLVGAIAAGNCVILKPSEVTGHTAELLANQLPKYLDQRAYNVITGAVAETTALLKERFDHIFYTGNGHVGRIVMQAAAEHLTPVTLELGGKSPAIVAPDADLSVTANRIIWGKFFNTGQTCVAPDYVLVTKDTVEPLMDAFRKSIINFYGDNPQKELSYGRIVNQRHFDRLKGLLDALDKDSIYFGGQTDRDDLYIAPTLVGPLKTMDAEVMKEEIFGPVLPVVVADDVNAMIRMVNARDTPLAMYIFAKDPNTYHKIVDNTRSGGVLVNDTLMHLQEMSLPFGGMGASGMGNYHGDNSFYTFTHERATMIKYPGLEGVLSARYPPYNEDKEKIMYLLVYGFNTPRSMGSTLRAVTGFCSAMWRFLFSKKKKE